MCYECWEKAGRPMTDNAAVREAITAITAVYDYSASGGNLHVAVDDYNLEDDVLERCKAFIEENVDEGDTEQLEAERRCLALLTALPEMERYAAVARYDGYLN